MIKFNTDLVKTVIDELNGLEFNSSSPYSESEKVFFEDRYLQLLKLLPEISTDALGLEVGLAGGVLAILLRRALNLNKLYALEHPITAKMYTKKYLKKLREDRIILKPLDLRRCNFPWNNNFFDFIMFSEVMEHLIPADIPGIIAELKRILKKDGYLIITTPNIASLLKRINLAFGKNPIEFDLNMHDGATFGHIREYTMSEVISILESHDFKIIMEGYFSIDKNRNIFTQIESKITTVFPKLGNNLIVVSKK